MAKYAYLLPALLLPLYLPGCGTAPPRTAQTTEPSKPGGYYLDDGPGDNPPADLGAIPDAEPRIEPLHKFANNPYSVLGRLYVPETRLTPYRARGTASWYGKKFHGQKTSSGEPYDMYAMTAAHPTLPIPSYARVSHLASGRSVVVRINDRGPFHDDRLIDLSYAAAYRLGMAQAGSAPVEVESIDPQNSAAKAVPVPVPAPGPAPAAAAPLAGQPLPPAAPEENGQPADSIYLQLGAFSAQGNAETFGARIRPQLGPLADALRIFQQDGLFRVHLGPYRSATEAGAAAAQVRQSLKLSPLEVVRLQ